MWQTEINMLRVACFKKKITSEAQLTRLVNLY